MEDPTRHLTPPTAPSERLADGYVNVTQALDYASPTAWLNAAIEGMTGTDVVGTIVRPISGDWERIGRYGDALGHVAACLGDIAIQVQSHALLLGARWTGNASDAAYVYFTDTATSLSRHAVLLQLADRQYTKLALDVWHLSEQLRGLVQSICDQAVVALIEMAAGTALIETGVGTVAGYALAALQVAAIVRTIARASVIIQAAAMVISTGVATLGGILLEFGDLDSVPVPAHAYRSPVVAG